MRTDGQAQNLAEAAQRLCKQASSDITLSNPDHGQTQIALTNCLKVASNGCDKKGPEV